MTARVAFVVLLAAGPAPAALPPKADDLSRAYYAAVADLRAGKNRQEIADRLGPVVDKNRTSSWLLLAGPFHTDLRATAGTPPAAPTDPPEKRLADARGRGDFHLIRFAENRGRPLAEFVTKMPKSLLAELATADRGVIGRFIPLLTDRTPTRCDDGPFHDWKTPQPRVGDLALELIEFHGKVRFPRDAVPGAGDRLPAVDYPLLAARVAEWWAANKDKPVAAGVRAQLPHVRSHHQTIEIAKTLATLADATNDDRAFGRGVLLDLVKRHSLGGIGADAADALAELGDLSPLNVFHDAWVAALGRPDPGFDWQIAYYFGRHGGRREWELMDLIARREAGAGKGPGDGVMCGAVMNAGDRPYTHPYAVPFLGLALHRTENTGARYIDGDTVPFSRADTACEALQRQTGKDFGYRPAAPAAERLAAIAKARAWWDAEGKAAYTFDAIDARRVAKP